VERDWVLEQGRGGQMLPAVYEHGTFICQGWRSVSFDGSFLGGNDLRCARVTTV
jgi:hypothetical protein